MDSKYTFLDVFLTVESNKSGPETIRLSFLGENRKKPFFGLKISPKNRIFGLLGHIIINLIEMLPKFAQIKFKIWQIQ